MKWNKYLSKMLIISASIAVLTILTGFILNCIFSHNFKFNLDFRLFFDGKTYLYAFLLSVIALMACLSYCYNHYWLKNSRKIIQGYKHDNDITTNLEAARFQIDQEVDKNFMRIEYAELANKEIVGIPVRAVQKKNGYDVNFAPNAHTMIIGTTGSGKTTTFINPTIQILSQSAAKPSMLVSDPKGELYALHAKSLTEKGYTVKVLDLRNPYHSVRWNPLERPYKMYQRMLYLDNEFSVDEENGCYTWNDKIYNNPDDLHIDLQVEKQRLYDEIYEDLHDTISVLCPVANKGEPIWESGAKNLILAIAIAMLEDSANPELGMTQNKYNFYNLTKIATNTENDCDELIKYFQGRGPLSKSTQLSKQVLDSADKTRGSYLSTMFDKLNLFSDLSLCGLTSENEIIFADMAEQPIVLFLQIPDEKETRHVLAAMIMLHAYKELVAKANSYPNLSLPRSVYFLMDEFGNLPPIHKMEQMITVGRSRNIWLCLVVQSYSQLAKVYDEKVSEIIKSNCNIQIFIGTSDQKTIEEFSKRCGNFSVLTRSVGYNTAKTDDINSNASIKERPLIYPSELAQLNCPGNMGNAIVTVFGYHPILSRYTPSFACTAYKLTKSTQCHGNGQYFDENAIIYDMKRRNEIVMPQKNVRQRVGFNVRTQLNTAIESLKEQVECVITSEFLDNSKQIALLNLLDRHCFLDAQNLVDIAYQKAVAIKSEQADKIYALRKRLKNLAQIS